MVKLEKWCSENGLKMNVSKTKCMNFYKAHDLSARTLESGKVYVNNKEVEFVDSFRYLGIEIDKNLTFKKHEKVVEARVCGAISKLYTIKRILPIRIIKTVLSAYVISITDFVINIWGVRSTGLETIQKKINVFVLAYFLPSLSKKRAKSKLAEVDINQFLEKLDLLTVCERRKLSLLKFVFKKRHFRLFDGFFTNKSRSRRELDRLNVPAHRTALYKQSLKWSGTTVWNEYYKYFCICDDDVTFTEFVEICKRQIVFERGKIYV
ncbi:unnamed protein product [Orchesella dallaii]|uniref:Reverse transcriptase n=1 Tax=Orchesella dallaii TaxID=48710 RepID=A0ABP1QS68_9HEXA